MSTLSPIDHPTDFFTKLTPDVALIVCSPSADHSMASNCRREVWASLPQFE
jgi:hypothetical protein